MADQKNTAGKTKKKRLPPGQRKHARRVKQEARTGKAVRS